MENSNQIEKKDKSFFEKLSDATKHPLIILGGGSIVFFSLGFTTGVKFSENENLPVWIREIIFGKKLNSSSTLPLPPSTGASASTGVSADTNSSSHSKNVVIVGPFKIEDAEFSFTPYPGQPSYLKGLLSFTVSNTGLKDLRFAIVDEISIQTNDSIDFSSRYERMTGIGYCSAKQIDVCKYQDGSFVTIAPGGTSNINVVLKAPRPTGTLKENQIARISSSLYRREANTDNAWIDSFSIKNINSSFRP